MRSKKLCTAALWIVSAVAAGSAAEAAGPPTPRGVSAGGAVEQSFTPPQGLPSAPLSHVPRFRYGFSAPAYEWGWFGAKHYYPRTTSHRGYNGDYWQWAYRRGW